jgi:hypothetical protein
MEFHVEIRRGLRSARVFNLDGEELRRTVVEPWCAGRPLTIGDREWLPADCELRILDGPLLEPLQLARGEGWRNAERTAIDVARDMLGDARLPAIALHTDGERGRRLAEAAFARLGWRAVAWGEPAAFAVYVVEPEDDDERAVGALVERLRGLAAASG